MTVRVIDTETTGTDPKKDSVIEVASIDLARDGSFHNAMSSLIALPPGLSIPPQASAVHHIVDADLIGAQDVDEAIRRFAGASVYVAHNAAFDASFLPSFGPWICTYKCALRHWPDAPGHSNQVLRYWLKLYDPLGIKRKDISPHAALSDVYVTGAIAHVLLREVAYDALLEWSAEPAVYAAFTFGKHKGTKLSDAPADYLEWIEKSDMSEDWKWNARREMSRRAEQAA